MEPIDTVEEFLAVYGAEASDGSMEWRSRPIASNVCLALLKQGFSPEVLLLNKKLPAEALEVLSTHPDPRIRSMVADKRSAGALLMKLASDPDLSVRLRVAWNAKVPEHLLRSMLDDAAPEVRDTARLRILRMKGEPENS